MSELTEFLLARIAEDEAEATRSVLRKDLTCPVCGGQVEAFITPATIGGRRPNRPDRIEPCKHELTAEQSASCRVDTVPARVLAECAAKRQIVEAACPPVPADLDRHSGDFETGWTWAHSDALAALAAIYADHPDYRAEWAL